MTASLSSVRVPLSARYPIFIVSNCQAGYIEAFHLYHGLENHLLTGNVPATRVLRKRRNQARHRAQRTQVSGLCRRVAGDCDAARACGLPFVFAAYGFGIVDKPDAVMSGFTQICDLV